jgi:hypothetical protein
MPIAKIQNPQIITHNIAERKASFCSKTHFSQLARAAGPTLLLDLSENWVENPVLVGRLFSLVK